MTPNPGISSDGESLTRTQKTFTMVGALLGLLLAALDQTIVATAGPDIQRDLRIEPSLYVWITTAYLVASTVLVPIYGKLSDLYGRKRILLIAIGIFLLGSLLCGISQSPAQLIAFRAVQGIGSAGLFTSAFAVVADLFPPAERGKYQGLFGAAFGVSSVIGPLLGGFITDHFGWHWVFFVNLPIGAIVFLPLFMVNVVGLSATSSGLTTTPLTFGIVAANIATGHLVSRLGKYKALLLGSLVVLVAGFVIFALTLEPDATQLGVSAKMVILGIGLGPAIPLFTLAIQSAVKPAQIGVATSSATFARQMGATIGLAIVGTVFATSFSARLHEDMPVALRDAPPVLTEVMARQRADHSGEGNAQVAFDAPKVKQAITASIAHLPIAPEQRAAVQAQADASVDRVAATFKQAFTGAIVRVFWVSLGIALLGLLITLVLPVVPLRKAAGPPPPVE
jgi:MFS family permease